MVLRHQLNVLRRQVPRPRLEPAGRALLAATRRVLPRSRWSCFLVKPETLLRWHRCPVGCTWPDQRRRRGDTDRGRPLRWFAEPGQRGGVVLWRTTRSARSRCRPGREVAWERTAAILSSRIVTALAPTWRMG